VIEDEEVDFCVGISGFDGGNGGVSFCWRTTAHIDCCVLEGKKADGFEANSSITSSDEIDSAGEVWERGWIKFRHV